MLTGRQHWAEREGTERFMGTCEMGTVCEDATPWHLSRQLLSKIVVLFRAGYRQSSRGFV